MISIRVDGIISAVADSPTSNFKNLVRESKIPIVFIDRDPGIEGSVFFTSDNENGMFQAANYIVSLGHKKILYVDEDRDLYTIAERRKGMKKAVALYPDVNIEHIKCNITSEAAYQKIDNMIKDGKLDATAVCAATDRMALGVCTSLQANGYKIPEDISVIGFDNIPESAMINLTTVNQPLEEIGRMAIISLMSLIHGRDVSPLHRLMETSLVIRSSCKNITA